MKNVYWNCDCGVRSWLIGLEVVGLWVLFFICCYMFVLFVSMKLFGFWYEFDIM